MAGGAWREGEEVVGVEVGGGANFLVRRSSMLTRPTYIFEGSVSFLELLLLLSVLLLLLSVLLLFVFVLLLFVLVLLLFVTLLEVSLLFVLVLLLTRVMLREREEMVIVGESESTI